MTSITPLSWHSSTHRVKDQGTRMPETLFCSPNTLSLEKKAAHLLYFLVKNHHFVDGKSQTRMISRWISRQP